MSLDVKVKKYTYFHLLCFTAMLTSSIIFYFLGTYRWDHPLWPNTRLSIIFLFATMMFFHLTVFNAFRKVLKQNSKEERLEKLLLKHKPIIVSFQIVTLIGLGMVLFDFFYAKTILIQAMGISILFTFGIEFLLNQYVLWNLEEDLRRMKRNS